MKDCIERNIQNFHPKKIALNEKVMIEYCYRMAGIVTFQDLKIDVKKKHVKSLFDKRDGFSLSIV